MKQFLDIVYKRVGDIDLYIDLYMPDDVKNPPLIFYIHGGSWIYSSRKNIWLLHEVERGYALASIEYRLSNQSSFPGHIIDCKDALYFLKHNAEQYGYDPERIIAAGDSAGGQLASLMATSAGYKQWESKDGDYSLSGVIDMYGPMDFTTLTECPELEIFYGFGPEQTERRAAVARSASPLTYLTEQAPPFLIIHGEADSMVPIYHSILLRDALEKANVPVSLYRMHGTEHDAVTPAAKAAISEFLDYYGHRYGV